MSFPIITVFGDSHGAMCDQFLLWYVDGRIDSNNNNNDNNDRINIFNKHSNNKINEFNDDDQNINPSYNNDNKHDYVNDVLFAIHYSYISN